MKKIIYGLGISSLLALGLVSCGGEQTLPPPPPPDVEVQTKAETFTLNLDVEEGATLENLTAATEGKYVAGSSVSFGLTLNNNTALDGVYLGETRLTEVAGTYTFTMPNKDATLKVETTVVSNEDLLSVTDIAPDFAGPTDAAGLKTLLGTTKEANGKYFANGRLDSYIFGKSVYLKEYYHVDITAGRGNTLNIKGSTSTDGKTFNTSSETRAVENDHFYTHLRKLNGSKVEETVKTKNVIADLEEEGAKAKAYEIENSEALAQTSSFDIVGLLERQYLNNTWLSRETTTISTKVADDHKTFTTTFAETLPTGTQTTFNELSVTIDGNNFLRGVTYSSKEYLNENLTETGELKEDAVAKTEDVLAYTAEAGYRTATVSTLDFESYTYDEYDVLVSNTIDGTNNPKTNEGVVYLGTEKTTFKFKNKGTNFGIIDPYFVGLKEENAHEFVTVGEDYNGTYLQGLKEGTVTALFDNGTGTLKEITLTVKQPDPKNISVFFQESEVLEGQTAVLSVTLTPVTASQEVTITPTEASAKCEVTPTDDPSTYHVLAKEVGTIELVVASKAKPELTRTVSLTVSPKPNPTEIRETITTKTLEYSATWESRFRVNFNADGTGRWSIEEYTYSGYAPAEVGDFTWTLDDTTLAFTITAPDPLCGETFTTFAALSATNFTATTEYYGSPSLKPLTVVDRLEL